MVARLVLLGVFGLTVSVCNTQARAEATSPWLDRLLAPLHDGNEAPPATPLPFSFLYDGKPGADLMPAWKRNRSILPPTPRDREGGEPLPSRSATSWTDPKTGLRVTCETARFADYSATEWLLWFENTGTADTPIIADVRALDVMVAEPLTAEGTFRLHRTVGAPSNPTDFEASQVVVDPGHRAELGAGGGRSSNRDFPFFKIEAGFGSLIVAAGWSGQWLAELDCPQPGLLRIRAGLEKTHFRLAPGEKVRMPRILLLHGKGDTLESNAAFRQLIQRHYVATRGGKIPLPTLFCNTCFTRGGGWLNETTADNQISLIRAYAPLGLEALLTDAGWFEGGWPDGAGNWTPRKDSYPDGMAPVAAAAKEHGMIYGLWFEPERVVAGTALHREHPQWLLGRGPDERQFLLNLGLPEAREHFLGIASGFLKLPGFGFYRQDFNMDPLEHWRAADAPDRQGITELKYIEGLYAYWDRITELCPDGLREECASGGRRIDLETVMRMHLHQKTDYWFDNETDQASLWGLSQYLPNNTVVAHVNRLDDYSFHSTMASSLCLGWIADAPDFDVARARKLVERYRAVRHLLVGAWYPLLPYSRGRDVWMASQYHRSDLDEGMLLVFRREHSPYRTVDLALHGLRPDASYELFSDRRGSLGTATGESLLRRLELTLPDHPQSDLIFYRRRPTDAPTPRPANP